MGSEVLLNFRQISQRHGRIIDEWSNNVLTALALMACYHNSHTPSLMCHRRAGHSAPRRHAEDDGRNLNVVVAFRFADANNENLFLPGRRR
jgi:hypothetical protein